jgi:hypothetical protein
MLPHEIVKSISKYHNIAGFTTARCLVQTLNKRHEQPTVIGGEVVGWLAIPYFNEPKKLLCQFYCPKQLIG